MFSDNNLNLKLSEFAIDTGLQEWIAPRKNILHKAGEQFWT